MLHDELSFLFQPYQNAVMWLVPGAFSFHDNDSMKDWPGIEIMNMKTEVREFDKVFFI